MRDLGKRRVRTEFAVVRAGGSSHRQHPQSIGRHRHDLGIDPGKLGAAEMTELSDRFRRTLGRNQAGTRLWILPNLGHRQQIRCEGIGMQQTPGQLILRMRQCPNRAFHRIKWVDPGRQNRVSHQTLGLFG